MGIILNFITRSRLDHEVFMFDVGHGDCVLIIDDMGRGLLVDCGSRKPSRYFKVPGLIENFLLPGNKCGFVVSHYHRDHYSLFRWFKHSEALLSNIYLPDLPIIGPGRQAALAIMDFLKVSVFADFSDYRILPEIFKKTRRPIVFCKKGVTIPEASLHLKVFWPDLYHPSLENEKVKRKANAVREIIEPTMDRYGIPKPSKYGTDYSMERFFRDLEIEEIQYHELREQVRKEICKTLEQVERAFSELANIFSIAFRTYYKRKSRFLFLGDLTGNILNQISIPGTNRYDCMKAAHHGTEFGSALKDMSTKFLLVSRNERYKKIKKIHDGYISKMRYKMLLSTGFLGDCYIC